MTIVIKENKFKQNIKNVSYKKEKTRGEYKIDTTGYITLPELLRACTRPIIDYEGSDVCVPSYIDKTDAIRQSMECNDTIKRGEQELEKIEKIAKERIAKSKKEETKEDDQK